LESSGERQRGRGAARKRAAAEAAGSGMSAPVCRAARFRPVADAVLVALRGRLHVPCRNVGETAGGLGVPAEALVAVLDPGQAEILVCAPLAYGETAN